MAGSRLIDGVTTHEQSHDRLSEQLVERWLLGVGPSRRRVQNGAGIFSLSRNIGSSVGISVVNSLLTTNTQVNHAEIAQHVTSVNRLFEDPVIAQFWNPATAAGRAALDAVVTRQAQIIAYIDDYKLLMIATLAVIPLLIVFKQASGGHGSDHAQGVEL